MNVLIVEDEKHTALLLKEVIEQDDLFIVNGILESIAETVAFLKKHKNKIDLIFLDIHLADGYSFEIFQQINLSLPVIFCTAYEQFSLHAIKNNGIDYILKPFHEEEVHDALNRYKMLATNFSNKSAPRHSITQTCYQESFLTQQREKSIVVYTKDIALFSIEFETVQLYTFSGEKHALFKNLEYIESVCDPRLFFRINRQMLINRNAVKSIEPYFHRKIVVHLTIPFNEKPLVSRLKVSPFKDWLCS